MVKVYKSGEFQSFLSSKKGSDDIIILDLFATWCGPCSKIGPVFEELSKKYTKAEFCKVDVDEAEDIASDYDVSGLPTFVAIKGGKPVGKLVGGDKVKLEEFVKKHCA